MSSPSVPHPHASHNLVRWYFTRPEGMIDDALSIVAWWEIRRIPFNFLVGYAGVASITVWLSIGSLPFMSHLVNSEDAVGVDTLAVLGAPFLFNFCYTAGWVCEIALKLIGVRRTGSMLLKLGTGLSLTMVSFVGVYWFVALLVEVVFVLARTAS
jgi:hypothetical protein